MATIDPNAPIAVAAVEAIRAGDVAALELMLAENADLATARIGADGPDGVSRTLLHVVTDWPGNLPNGAAIVAALVKAGADVNARFHGPHRETPLHWAASCDDVDVLDALLDAGADIEAAGAVLGGGSPLADATGFAQWNAARRLVERGASSTAWDAAALGLIDRLKGHFAEAQLSSAASQAELNGALWAACHGGQREAAGYLLDRGAEVNWRPRWQDLTPLDAAQRNGFHDMVAWLRERGGWPAGELTR